MSAVKLVKLKVYCAVKENWKKIKELKKEQLQLGEKKKAFTDS